MLKSNNYGSTEPLINDESDTKTTTKWKTSRIVAIALLLLFTAGAAYFTIHDAAHSSSAIGVNRQYDVEMEEEEYTADDDIDLEDDDDIDLEADKRGGKKGGKGGKGKGSKPTKGPKPTKAPKPTKGPKGPKPTAAPPSVSSGLRCYTVKGSKPGYKVPADFSRLDAMCQTGIRTGCSAMYTGALADYKGNWGVTASFEEWKPDNDQGCAGGYYGGDNEDQFQVEARCCEDSAGKLGVRIMHGQTKTNVEIKFDDGGMCIGTLNEDIDKQGLMYLGCGVSADITMDASGDTWSGSLDPGFGGVRRRPDGTCKGQTFSESATDTCTNKDVQAGKECKDSPTSIIYLDEEDVVYMNSIMHDREKIHEYKQTLIENAGYSVDDEVKFEVEGDDTADWLKADCGRGYWASWRDTEGWQLETISIPKTVNGKTFDCNIVDSDWSIFNNNLGLYESVVGCAKSAGGHDYDYGALVDCSSYINKQIEECDTKGGMKKNYGSYYDGDLCKARSSSPEIRAQAVCCTYK